MSPKFDPDAFLASAGEARHIRVFSKRDVIFSQGAPADTVMYIQKGNVRVTVVNERGREAIVGLFGPGDFFGEQGMAGQSTRKATAKAVLPSTILIIENAAMEKALTNASLSKRFMDFMLHRNIRVEADLVDQLFNSTEKRLARALLLLARYGEDEHIPEKTLRKTSQEALAEMIGTTRSRVNIFMNKFRKMGFIDYNGGIKINKSLLNVVLHD